MIISVRDRVVVTIQLQTQHRRKGPGMIRPNDLPAGEKNEQCRLPEATPRNLVVTYVSEEPAAFSFRVYSYQTIRRHIQSDSHLESRYLPVVGKNTMKYARWVVSLRPSI